MWPQLNKSNKSHNLFNLYSRCSPRAGDQHAHTHARAYTYTEKGTEMSGKVKIKNWGEKENINV